MVYVCQHEGCTAMLPEEKSPIQYSDNRYDKGRACIGFVYQYLQLQIFMQLCAMSTANIHASMSNVNCKYSCVYEQCQYIPLQYKNHYSVSRLANTINCMAYHASYI